MQALEERTWGSYEVLLDTVYCKVKEIIVQPGQRLSYQSHKHREETWTVTYGILTVIREGTERQVHPGESGFIRVGDKHRAWNKTPKAVHFIEVQTGDYFDEDDIIRYEDDYMRSDDVQEFLEEMDKPGPWSEEDDKIHTIGGLSNDKEGSFMKFQNKLNKNG